MPISVEGEPIYDFSGYCLPISGDRRQKEEKIVLIYQARISASVSTMLGDEDFAQ
jgi:hypothetical protein